MVVPPMWVAAMPVGAVMATAREKLAAKTWRKNETIICVTNDLPGGGGMEFIQLTVGVWWLGFDAREKLEETTWRKNNTMIWVTKV